MTSRPVMMVVIKPQPREAEPVHIVTFGSERFWILFRALDPIIEVREVRMAWQATIHLSDGRELHGYGASREDAFRRVHESAASSGALVGIDMGLVMHTVCAPDTITPKLWS